MELRSEAVLHAPTPFIEGYQWLTCRYDPADLTGLVLAAKGGHNAEDHNQNDIGQFTVHLNGELLVLDPHCVPVVNGFEQPAHPEWRSELLNTDFAPTGDCTELDLKGAYPAEAGLDYLRRRLCLVRMQPAGQVIVRDDFRFLSGPGVFESRIHTLAAVQEVAPGYLRLRGERATMALKFDSANIKLEIEELLSDGHSYWGPVLRRLRFSMKAQKDSVILRFVPEPH